MRWFRTSLFLKFLAVMGALALIPVTYLAVSLSVISQQGIQAAVLELHTKLAEKLADQAEDYFRVNDDKLLFALAALRSNMEWKDKQELLLTLIETHRDVQDISVLNRRGMEAMKVYNPTAAEEAVLVSRAEEDGYKELLKTGRRTMRVVRERGGVVLLMYYPINELTTARFSVSLSNFGDRISRERVGGTGFAVLADEQGIPLFYAKEKLHGPMEAGFPGWPIVKAALQSQSIGSSEFTVSGDIDMVGAYAPVRNMKGAVIILQARSEAYQAAIQMRRTSILIFIVVVIVAVLASTFMARRLTSPLISLTNMAREVGKGNFDTSVTIATNDELQDLAETFNQMSAEMKRYSDLQVDRVIEAEKKTGAIVYSINEGILLTDPEGRIQLGNKLVCELLGVKLSSQLEGKTIDEAVSEGDVRDALLQVNADPKPDVFKEVNIGTLDQARYYRLTANQTFSQRTGQAMGIVTSFRDVTLEKELEKMKDEFLQYITHDLRNPLGSAMGFVEVLLKGVVGPISDEQRKIVTAVQRSLGRLMALVNNILDIAKMESDRVALQLQSMNLEDVAARSIVTLTALADQKKVKMGIAGEKGVSIQGDSDLLERVFNNLLGNAIKYTPQDGSITITIKDEGKSVRVTVSDTGDGIPKDFLGKIFEKFEQVTGQRKGGTGLGLTITKFFVESHLGRIWVESEVGKGANFIFTIPKNLVLDDKGKVNLEPTV